MTATNIEIAMVNGFGIVFGKILKAATVGQVQ